MNKRYRDWRKEMRDAGATFNDSDMPNWVRAASIVKRGSTRQYVSVSGCGRRDYMHRLVARASSGQSVDHINGNGLDNRPENLRICSHANNCRNTARRRDNTTGYKGVSIDKRYGRYAAAIWVNGRKRGLGYYDDPEVAALAYDVAAKMYFGDFAKPNKANELAS